MPGILVPMSGLAMGALGRLITNRRSQQALAAAPTSGSQEATTSETSLATAASDSFGPDAQTKKKKRKPQAVSQDVQATVTQPATGPVLQNQGGRSPEATESAGVEGRIRQAQVKRKALA